MKIPAEWGPQKRRPRLYGHVLIELFVIGAGSSFAIFEVKQNCPQKNEAPKRRADHRYGRAQHLHDAAFPRL